MQIIERNRRSKAYKYIAVLAFMVTRLSKNILGQCHDILPACSNKRLHHKNAKYCDMSLKKNIANVFHS